MSKYKLSHRLLALTLSIVMVVGMMPATAMAQADTDLKGEIIAFEELSKRITDQEVLLGTLLEDLVLPKTLNVIVRLPVEIEENELEQGSGENGQTVSDYVYSNKVPKEPEFMEIDIPIPTEWVSLPDYDGEKAGVYIFTAHPVGFTIAKGVDLPQIIVTVDTATNGGIITSFEELADHIRWQIQLLKSVYLSSLSITESRKS